MLVFRHGAVGVLACSILLLSGCGDTSLHDTWKGTKKVYYEYVNPPASIDYDDSGDLDDSESLLARNMQVVDTTLTRFERYMMNQDKPPTQDEVNALLERFRWVSGVVALSAEGEILAQQPAGNIKKLDFKPLLEVKPLRPRDLRGMVQITDFGPEVLLGAPVYNGTELQGLYIAHFDIRMLLDGVPDPGNLVITSPQGVLWPGVFGGTPLEGQDWAEVVKHSTSGTVSDGQGKFYWMCRYLGGLPLIFASPAKENTYPVNPAQLDALRELGIAVPEPVPAEEEMAVDAVDAPVDESVDQPAVQAPEENNGNSAPDAPQDQEDDIVIIEEPEA